MHTTHRTLTPSVALALALSLALSACGGVQGSCGTSSGTGGTCVEYSGVPQAAVDAAQNACMTTSGTWAAGACTRANALGSCRRPLELGSQTTVFYGGNAEILRMVCTSSGGTWSN